MGGGFCRVAAWTGVCVGALLVLSACDRGPASIPARDHGASLGAASSPAGSPGASGEDRADADLRVAATRDDPRDAPIPLVNGKPMWAANKRHTAEENARYQFSRDGADFGAHDLDDFVAKAHAFVDKPPSGAETLTRHNGDKLIYDAKANVFAVVSREGAPRTMFKPRDGGAYWAEQKQRAAEDTLGPSGQGDRRYGSYHGRRSSKDDDQG